MESVQTVLVVDDSATIRDQVRRALAPAGFHVVEARDGVDGLARLEAEPAPAVVLCDVHMPRMDGLELLEKLRAQGFGRPVLMLTTEGYPDLIRRAKAAGARGWIIKPFEPIQLAKTVAALSARAAGGRP